MYSTPDRVRIVGDEVPDADVAVAPSQRLLWRESMTVVEYTAARLSGQLIEHWPRGDGHPVIVLPGFLTGPRSTKLLRDVLRRLGYQAYDWGSGFNRGYRSNLIEDLHARVRHVQDRAGGQRVSLIGWSVGGVYAREVARMLPDHVRTVITLGSPFRGNHRATHAWRTWQLFNRRDITELISHAARIERAQPVPAPTTCIYSKSDGIVAWECCTSVPAPRTENVEVRSTHVGYGHNLETLYVIADRLAQPEGSWRPYNV